MSPQSVSKRFAYLNREENALSTKSIAVNPCSCQTNAYSATHSLCLTLMSSLLYVSVAQADSVPFWGAKASVAVETPIGALKKGEFLWVGDALTAGPVVMVVSLTEQRAYVYRNGLLIGATTVSTGRPGHVTPTGVFTVLQKEKEHRSTIYDGAPMPYMERLTWGGIALHAGGLPGYPESHGCVHLPSEFARRLFEMSPNGMTVVIASDATAPKSVAHPGYLAPVNFVGGAPIEPPPLDDMDDQHWNPEFSPSGPISVVLSQGSRRIVVYRNGIEIGRAPLSVAGDEPLASQALVLAQGPSAGADPYVPDPAKFRWMRIGLPGHAADAGTTADPAARDRIKIPADFVSHVNSVLTPGATVFLTDEGLSAETSGMNRELIDANPPSKHR